MQWYVYVASLFAGGLIGNAIPHLVQGVSGNAFPTPFAKPPGRGLSSPMANVLWALFNFVVGYGVLRIASVNLGDTLAFIFFCIGFAAISIFSSVIFEQKQKE